MTTLPVPPAIPSEAPGALSWRGQAVRELAAVTAGAIAALALLAWRTSLLTTGNSIFAEPGWDHHAYITMARGNPFDFHIAPFGWRILVPAVAKVLPLGLQTSFFSIAFTCLAGAAIALYYTFRAAHFGRLYATLGVVFFLSLGWAAKFALMDFWLPDAAVYLAICLGLLFAIRRQPVAFALTLAAGAAAKESVIFILPLYYTLNTKGLIDRKHVVETLLVALPAVAVLLALRLAIPGQNDDLGYAQTLSPQMQAFREFIPSYDYYDLLRDIGWHQRLHDHRTDTLLLYTTGTWGLPLLALAAFGVIRRPGLALRLSPFLVLVYSQLLFAVNIERLLVLGFPAVVWLALEGVGLLVERLRSTVVLAFALGAALFGLNFLHPAEAPIRIEFHAALFVAWICLMLALPKQLASGDSRGAGQPPAESPVTH